MIAPVRCMAGPAIFLHRGMFPEVGTAFFGMAFVTEFVDRSGLDKLFFETTMMVMAIRTFDFTFFYGVMRLFRDLHAQIPVTGETQIGLRGFQIHLFPGMDRMAVVTGDAGRLVGAHIPMGKVSRLGVTIKAFGRLCGPVNFLISENKNIDTPAAALLDVGFAVAMAGFTSFSIGRAFVDRFFCMGRIDVCVIMPLMTGLARFRSASFFRAH